MRAGTTTARPAGRRRKSPSARTEKKARRRTDGRARKTRRPPLPPRPLSPLSWRAWDEPAARALPRAARHGTGPLARLPRTDSRGRRGIADEAAVPLLEPAFPGEAERRRSPPQRPRLPRLAGGDSGHSGGGAARQGGGPLVHHRGGGPASPGSKDLKALASGRRPATPPASAQRHGSPHRPAALKPGRPRRPPPASATGASAGPSSPPSAEPALRAGLLARPAGRGGLARPPRPRGLRGRPAFLQHKALVLAGLMTAPGSEQTARRLERAEAAFASIVSRPTAESSERSAEAPVSSCWPIATELASALAAAGAAGGELEGGREPAARALSCARAAACAPPSPLLLHPDGHPAALPRQPAACARPPPPPPSLQGRRGKAAPAAAFAPAFGIRPLARRTHRRHRRLRQRSPPPRGPTAPSTSPPALLKSSVGAERLLANCGTVEGASAEAVAWREALRKGAAHNALMLREAGAGADEGEEGESEEGGAVAKAGAFASPSRLVRDAVSPPTTGPPRRRARHRRGRGLPRPPPRSLGPPASGRKPSAASHSPPTEPA